ncbi:hypothetical protein NP199_24815, partial [Salmonella enterica]|nr:hypothetical protein [Salmonella enterica]
KVTSEDPITITYNGPWHPMQFNNIFYENLGNTSSSVGISHSTKMSIFRKSINHHENRAFTFGRWQPFNEVHGDVSPH